MTRTHVAICMALLMVLSAGCLGFLTGEEPLEKTSDPVYVSNSGLAEAGYEHNTTEEIAFNESVTIKEETRELRLTNWRSEYAPSEDLGMFGDARFVAYTSPSVELLGQSVNPVGQLGDNPEELELLLEQQDGFESLEKVDETEVTTLGQDATVSEFNGTVTVKGQEADVTLLLTQVDHNGDHIVAYGVYPKGVDERENVLTLIENLERSDG